MRECLPAVFLTVLLSAPVARAVPDRLLQVVPADSLAVILFDRRVGASGEDGPAIAGRVLSALLEHARGMGLWHRVDATVGIVADAISLHPELARHPRAAVLLDVRADPLSDGGFRLGSISAGLVLVTGREHLRIERNIQVLLNLYADSDVARLTERKATGTTVHTLADRRLPGWALVEWGAVDDCYVIALGTGAFDRLARAVGDQAKRLNTDAWPARAHRRCRGAQARWEWYLDFDALCERLAPVMGEKPRDVLAELGLGDVSRGLWAVGPDARAVDAACVLDVGGRDRYTPLTIGGEAARAFDGAIPPQARSAAVIRARPAEMIPRACNAYLRARSPGFGKRLAARWTAIETEVGVDTDADILAHLGPRVIVHDFPHHPLGLPLLWTVLVEIDGSAESVRTALDRLLAHVHKTIEDRSGPAGLTRLERDDDGVWYVRFGLYGPALAVTDRWVVISYSPQAVRENVEYLEAVSKPTEDAQRRLKPAAPPVPAPPEQRAGRDAQTRTVPQR